MLDATLEMDQAQAPTTEAPATLTVRGHLPHPRTLGLEALAALPRREMGPTQINCFTGRPVTRVHSLAGVRLIDVLDASGFSTQPRSQLKRCVIAALGGDGYRALFSWCELYNADIGGGVLVLYERDGRPLPSGLGPLSLISANDRQLGPRHLRHLRGIQVEML
ncbi:molybdopterin-dependent oxidoreductase [Variovorax sp. KK3]|uniref:molybdopterin-dependent oxidoreductase n=1 Tax=Variovorax sp. KK3 TaxID=1855728 RepID=UPI00117D8D6D|nr:molybdopterin-dependent oxidoreductase [Variovorax sp. KK3]